MSSAETPAAPTPPASPAADDAYFQQVLRGLVTDGAKISHDLAEEPGTPAIEKAAAYERIARAIRRSIVLARHIAAHPAKAITTTPPRLRRTRDAEIAVANRAEPPERREYDEPDRDALERPEPLERLDPVERVERLETIASDRRFFARPISEIIAALQRDLRPAQKRRRRVRNHPRPIPARAASPRSNLPNTTPPQTAPPQRTRHPPGVPSAASTTLKH